MTSATVSARGARRWAAGHPWIYRSDVESSPAVAGIVAVRDQRGKFLGQALCSPRSEIRLRLLDPTDALIDADWWRRRIAHAAQRRAAIDANSWRAVHAEGDGLPALIVDRYDRWLVVQLLSATALAACAWSLDVEVPHVIMLAASAPIFVMAALPLGIAGFGTRELAAVAVLGLAGVPADLAAGTGLLYGLCGVIQGMLAAPLFLLPSRRP